MSKKVDKIVIGGSLGALLYAHRENAHVAFVRPRVPLFFEEYNGQSKAEIWHKLAFQLSLGGQLPMFDCTTSFRVENNTIKCFTSENYFLTIDFDEIVVFDDYLLEGWHGELKRDARNLVLDWIDDRRSSPHEIDYIETEDDFVRELYFYPSDRIDGNWSNKKDMLSVSYLSQEQLSDINYSDTIVRMKVLDMMAEAGIKGPKNGVSSTDPTKSKRLSIKLESRYREVWPMFEEPYDADDLLEGFSLSNGYLDGKEA